MRTAFTIFRVGAAPERREVDLPEVPGFDALRRVVEPLLDGARLEHVTVLHEGRRADMFVDEIGQLKGLPRNDEATGIYRNNWLTRHPGTDPEALPTIVGPAVLFDRRVWF